MRDKRSSRLYRGVVIYLDLDDYMNHVLHMSASAEIEWSNLLMDEVLAAASDHGVMPARSFGDAILLFIEAPVDSTLRRTCIDFLAAVKSRFQVHGLAFKAIIAAGSYYAGPEPWLEAGGVTKLTGPLLNLGGKKLRQCPSATILELWPLKDLEADISYHALTSGQTMRETTVPLAALGTEAIGGGE